MNLLSDFWKLYTIQKKMSYLMTVYDNKCCVTNEIREIYFFSLTRHHQHLLPNPLPQQTWNWYWKDRLQ